MLSKVVENARVLKAFSITDIRFPPPTLSDPTSVLSWMLEWFPRSLLNVASEDAEQTGM